MPTTEPPPVATLGSSGPTYSGVLLAIGAVVCIAIASVLVRWAAPLPSIEVTAGRMIIATLAVAGAAVLQGRPPRYKRADLPIMLGAGLVTALHFLAYIAALSLTTIAHALAFVYTAPIFVASLAAWRLGERLGRRQLLGMLIAVAGVAILAGLEPNLTPAMLLGDGLALISAFTFGIYSITGRGLRDRYPLLTYTTGLYGMAALWLLPAAALSFDLSRYTPTNLAALLALGLIPLGLGHTLYNAALRRLPAATVNTIATQEVSLGVLLAWLLLNEAPTIQTLLGVIITLAGVILVIQPGPTRPKQ